MPCWVDQEAIDFADGNDIPQILPWTTTHYAKILGRKIEFIHLMNKLAILNDLDEEELRHGYIADAHKLHVQQSEQWIEKAFSPTGPLGILLSGAIGSLMLFVDKPGTQRRLDEAKEAGKNEATV